MTTGRYAIYYAPNPASGFWRRASAWLGRDCATDAEPLQPRFDGVSAADFATVTADPRHYGFHATLKAPFELAEGCDEAGLVAALGEFAARQEAFEAALAPRFISRFLALCPAEPSAEIRAFHEDSVRDFEPFRRPLGEADLVRRRRAGLTEAQDRLLVEWGYPYVFEQFRYHMTLTGSLADEVLRTVLLEAATHHFAPDIGPHRFASVSLFRQADRAAPFMLIAQAPFGG